MKAFFHSTIKKMLADAESIEDKLDSISEILTKYGDSLDIVELHQQRIDDFCGIVYEVLADSEENSKLVTFTDDDCDEVDEALESDNTDFDFLPGGLVTKDKEEMREDEAEKITELGDTVKKHWGRINSFWWESDQ